MCCVTVMRQRSGLWDRNCRHCSRISLSFFFSFFFCPAEFNKKTKHKGAYGLLSQAESAHQVITPANIKLVPKKIRIFQNREEVIGPESAGTHKHTHTRTEKQAHSCTSKSTSTWMWIFFLKMSCIFCPYGLLVTEYMCRHVKHLAVNINVLFAQFKLHFKACLGISFYFPAHHGLFSDFLIFLHSEVKQAPPRTLRILYSGVCRVPL